MSKLEKVLLTLQRMEEPEGRLTLAPVSLTVAGLCFLVTLLSIPLTDLARICWLGVWVAIVAPWLGVSFGSLLKQTLYLLPLFVLIGIFNPILDREPLGTIGGIAVTAGWLSFFGIVLRGVLAVACALLLVRVCGFSGFCHALRHLRVPQFLITQLLMVFRYLKVLVEEALTMKRARESRGYGKKHYPLKMWGAFVGNLFIRSIDRAERIYRAMLSRGFTGRMPDFFGQTHAWGITDTIFLLLSLTCFIAVRFIL